MSRLHGSLEKDSTSAKILACVRKKRNGITSRKLASELDLPQSIVSTALISHMKAGRVSRVAEGRVYLYSIAANAVNDKGSTDGGGA